MQNIRPIVFLKGPEFEEMASLTLPRAEKVFGFPVEIVRTSEDAYIPSERLKYMSSVEHDDPILLFDADMVFRSWDWEPFDLDVFNAVLDYPLESWAGHNLRVGLGLDAKRAVNAGMWLATRKHRPVFEKAEELRKGLVAQNYILTMGDQTALNLALQQLEVPVNYIPISYNHQVSPVGKLSEVPEDTRVVHIVGNSEASEAPGEICDPKKKLQRVKEALDAFPLD